MRSVLMMSAMFVLTAAAAGFGQTPAPELKVGDKAPDFSLPGERRQDVQAVRLQGQTGRRPGLVPEGVHAADARSSANRSRSTAT